MLDLMGDVCVDLHRFHGIADASRMEAQAFFAIARRLPGYGGAVTQAGADFAERQKEGGRVISLAELQAQEAAAARQAPWLAGEIEDRTRQA